MTNKLLIDYMLFIEIKDIYIYIYIRIIQLKDFDKKY
jgi:hypothetical protein